MLSSQTKDQITAAAMKRLQEHGLSAEVIKESKEDELAELIKPVGFYRVKAKNLIKAAQLICAKFDGEIPETLEGLQSLPGVGPKMVNSHEWEVMQGLTSKLGIFGIAVCVGEE